MHYYGTEKTTKLLNIAMVIIIILGFIAGIKYGSTKMVPTEKAREAIEELASDGYRAEYYREEVLEEAKEKKLTDESIYAAVEVFALTAVLAILIYSKRHKIELLDAIAIKLKSVEKMIDEEQKNK